MTNLDHHSDGDDLERINATDVLSVHIDLGSGCHGISIPWARMEEMRPELSDCVSGADTVRCLKLRGKQAVGAGVVRGRQ